MGDATLLKPALNWKLHSDKSAQLNAEISYVTSGVTWEASYNLVAPESGDLLDIVAWITLQNRSGYTFLNASLQLMAGEVNKIAPRDVAYKNAAVAAGYGGGYSGGYAVTEQTFDEYHLYTLERPSTLENGETKQVEFLRASGVASKRVYVYEGYTLQPGENINNGDYYQGIQGSVGLTRNTRVHILREFRNSEANHLGKPLPAGVVRFYRRDSDGRLQFVGENRIQHTPKDETVRVYTGDAFDIVAERTRSEFKTDNQSRTIDESYTIKLRNHKKEAVQVQVIEHMYRGDNWEITAKSLDYVKKDSHTVEFTPTIPPDGEQTVSYSVHYSW